jgi:pyruvate formate lyase activating enzyme
MAIATAPTGTYVPRRRYRIAPLTAWPHGSRLALHVCGSIHSWDLATDVDGPGTRFVLFTAGCPVRCEHCAKPDAGYQEGGRRTTVRELLRQAEHYRRVLKTSGGGVTVSGGEPLMQASFTSAFLHGCKEAGLHTALDTSGYLGAAASNSMLREIDLTLLDLESFDPPTYRRVTGHDLLPTLRFAHRLANLGRPAWIRFVLVPGLTDAPANIEGVANYVAGLPNVERVDVLAQRRIGGDACQRIGVRHPRGGTPKPTPAQLESARGVFRQRGLAVR